ncbi:MAG: 4Fe-4S binding protein [Rhodopirellula sp.]|nr:4Fe-4S binding protein [Rhodopirellula sp.]
MPLIGKARKWGPPAGATLALLAFAVVPAALCQFLARPPQHRLIHVESFRYGKEPSTIRCNRGDWLHLTFDTRDTGHSFFLEEFDVDVKITPGSRNVAVFRATDPGAPPKLTDELVLKAEHPGWMGYLVSKSQYRCHVYCGPMHAFEHGNLVIEPNTLWFASIGLLAGIPIVGLVRLRSVLRTNAAELPAVAPTDGWDLFLRFPWLKRWMQRRGFQLAWVAATMLLLYVVVLTTLFGTHMPGRNLGVMLMWVVWLFLLTAVLTPLGGRIWCLACPLPTLGEIAQRGAVTGVRVGSTRGLNNRFFGLNLPWPRRLRNHWPRTLAFLILGTFSAVLVARPQWSGWLVLGLVVVATLMALVWELRAFCRYVCPVSAFVGLYSRSSKLALRATSPAICRRCGGHWCRQGSDKGWACPFGLCVGEINENTDCGICTECLKTCPFGNVTLRWRPFGHETRIGDASEAWLAMGMLVMAVAYCLIHLGPWPLLRDYVNLLDKRDWRLFGVYAGVLWTTALVGLPAVMLLLAWAGKQLARLDRSAWTLMTASTGALIPLGLMVWVAFVVPMLMVNVTFVRQSFSDPLGWGWDFLGLAGTPWRQLWPRAIPWIQAGCVLVGLSYGLRSTWRIWLEQTGRPRAALRGMTPLAAFLTGLSGWLLWFFSN